MNKMSIFLSCCLLMLGWICFPADGQEEAYALNREAWFAGPGELRVQLTILETVSNLYTIQGIGLTEEFPNGWTFDGLLEEYYGPDGAAPQGEGVNIQAWDNSSDFYWIQVPEFPIKLVYGLTVSGYDSGQYLAGNLFILTEMRRFEIASPITYVNQIPCLSVNRQVGVDAYTPGGEVAVQLQVDSLCEEPVQGLTVTEALSAPWTLKSVEITYTGGEEEIIEVTVPEIGSQSPLEFQWVDPPVFPVVIQYVMQVPETAEGSVEFTGYAVYGLSGPQIGVTLPAANIAEREPVEEGEGESSETGSLSGIVRNADTRLPLSGVSVTLMPGDYQITTGTLGTFSFTGLLAGEYTLGAARSEFFTYSEVLTLEAGINLRDIQLTPGSAEGESTEGEVSEGEPGEGEAEEGEPEGEAPETGSLSGVVRNADTELPLSEVSITLTPGDYQSTTGPLGTFSFAGLLAGEYTLHAVRAGFYDYNEAITLEAGINLRDIPLTPAPTEGEAPEGEGVEGEPVEGEPEGETPESGTLFGVVHNADTGLPLYGAQVALRPGDLEHATDRSGRYRFTGLPAGEYSLSATMSGYEDFSEDIRIVPGDNERDIALSKAQEEGEGEQETEGEGEPEEGEAPEDTGCCGCSVLSKTAPRQWRSYMGDLFLLGMALLVFACFKGKQG